MQYLSKIKGIRDYDFMGKVVLLFVNEVISIDGDELDFPDSSSFCIIGGEVYSEGDYYYNEDNVLVRPNHLIGLFFQGMYAGKIKKYVDNESTYIFTDEDKSPVVKIDRNEVEGNVIGLTTNHYLHKHKNTLKVHSLWGNELVSEINLDLLQEGDFQVYRNNIYFSDEYIMLYLHDKNWERYGFYVLDSISGSVVFKTKEFGPNFKLHCGKIYCIGGQNVWIMNVSDFSIEKVNMNSSLGDLVFVTQCVPYFYNNRLYVALRKKDEDIYSRWAEIDLERCELNYVTEMLRDPKKKPSKRNKMFVSKIKANEEFVGVGTSGNVLHVFSRKSKEV